ncbi:LptF/LptG family permease [Fusobacterium necrophorum]|uniref:LptF/LptG family permease n=1 Tax=Fusobacterium necrophorum TaxID=859 RepID=UPI0025501482|nr:LptF/LptG family permease [Fusobacterium necrophorum]MDK4485222.1 LptF/LptG family permease [Fusobacterium necrophorum]
MKKLDIYITKNFLKYFSYSLFSFLAIFVLSQIFKVLRYVNEGQLSAGEVPLFIGNLLPGIIINVAPLAVLLGGLISINIMASNLEIISLKTSGIRFARLVRGPILVSFFISLVVFYLNDRVYPGSVVRNRELRGKEDVEERELPKEKENAFFRNEEGRYVYYMKKINREKGIMDYVEILDMSEDFDKIERIITAKQGKYDFEKKIWIFKEVNLYYPETDRTESRVWIQDEKYRDEPDRFISLSNIVPKQQTIAELKKAIKEGSATGNEIREILLELGKRYSFPFASFVVSFLGLALGSHYVRGMSILNIVISILLGYAYYLVEGAFEALGMNGYLNPFLSGWIPNLLFLAAGLYFMRRAEY